LKKYLKKKISKFYGFTRLRQKAPRFIAGMNGKASLAEVPQSGTKAGLNHGFGEVLSLFFRKPRDLSRGGFTFLEILAALMILSVALIPIIAWVPTSIQVKLKVERKTIAIFLCQAKIEELRPKIINNFNADYQADAVAFVAPYQNFRYSVTDNLNPNLKTISVKVWHIENPQDEMVFFSQIARR